MSRREYELEKLLLGELPEPRASALREELRTDPALAAAYAALSASNLETLAAHPPRVVAAEVEQRFARSKKPFRWQLLVPVAVALVAVVIVARPAEVETDGLRTKGLAPALHVFRNHAGTIEELEVGATAAPGDQVQLRLVSAGAPFGVLVSIDGRAGVTLHFPLKASDEPKLEPALTLPRALELDDAPQFERFIFVTCTRRPDVAKVMVAAGSLAKQSGARVDPLTLEPGCQQQTSFVLGKESR